MFVHVARFYRIEKRDEEKKKRFKNINVPRLRKVFTVFAKRKQTFNVKSQCEFRNGRNVFLASISNYDYV